MPIFHRGTKLRFEDENLPLRMSVKLYNLKNVLWLAV